MGREIRMVPKDWDHPKNDGIHKALLEGYKNDAAEFMEMVNKGGLQAAVDYMGCPDKNDYMPDWSDEEKTHLMMYETVTEGTPLSPAFESPEELAQWLADNGASAFGNMTATYEQWLATCKSGWAPSAVFAGGTIRSGVEATETMRDDQ